MITIKISKRFMAGYITHAAATSLIYDYWGLEGTIRRMANGWISAWITVPIAIALLVLAGWLLFKSGDAA